MLAGLARPQSHGHLRVTGPSPFDPIEIVANTLSDPADNPLDLETLLQT